MLFCHFFLKPWHSNHSFAKSHGLQKKYAYLRSLHERSQLREKSWRATYAYFGSLYERFSFILSIHIRHHSSSICCLFHWSAETGISKRVDSANSLIWSISQRLIPEIVLIINKYTSLFSNRNPRNELKKKISFIIFYRYFIYFWFLLRKRYQDLYWKWATTQVPYWHYITFYSVKKIIHYYTKIF